MSKIVTLTISRQHIALGSFQLRYEAGNYQVFDGNQVIELTDGASLTIDDLAITARSNTGSNTQSYKTYNHIAEPDPILTRLRELSSVPKSPASAHDSLSFLNTPMLSSQRLAKPQGLPLSNVVRQAQKLSMLDQHFQPPNSISEQLQTTKQSTEVVPTLISSGNILRDLGFL